MSPGTGILSTGPLSRPAGEWMMVLDQRTQLFRNDMRVDLGGCYVGMAQHELHTAQIGAGFEQMAGEGMAQDVRRDAYRVDAGGKRRLLQELGETLPREMSGSSTRWKKVARGLTIIECSRTDMQPLRNSDPRGIGERYLTLFITLAAHHQHLGIAFRRNQRQ